MRTRKILGFDGYFLPSIGEIFKSNIRLNTPEGGEIECVYKVLREATYQEYLEQRKGAILGNLHSSDAAYFEVEILD